MADPITPLTPAQEAVQKSQAAHENFIMRDLVGLDVFASVLTGGKPNITISTRLGEDAIDGHGISKVVGTLGSEALDVLQPDHGAKAAAGDEERSEAALNNIKGSGI